MISIVPATEEHARVLARTLRDGDRMEIAALGVPAEQVIAAHVRQSLRAWTALDDGVPVFIWGFRTQSLIAHTAMLWALSAKGVERHKRALMEYSRDFVAVMQQRFPRLEAVVALDYPAAVRWLKWLGFQSGDIVLIGEVAFMRVWRHRPDQALREMPAANEWVH